MKDSYALITGASSGIGLEIADYMAKKGFNLIITSRTENKLKKAFRRTNFKIWNKSRFLFM